MLYEQAMTATADTGPDATADAPELTDPNVTPEISAPDTAVVLPQRTPRIAIDWAGSRITAGLIAAMSRAQCDIKPVGKGSRNDQGAGGKGYDYASADDMLREFRRAFSRQGLAVVFAHYMQDPPEHEPMTDRDGNVTQWLTCTLKIEAAVMHTNAKTGEVGILVVRGEQDAIGSRGRPNDKAQRAAETYALGFLARNLGCMDRGTTPKDEDRDQDADDSGGGGRRRGSSPAQSSRPAPASQQGKATDAGRQQDTQADKLHGLRTSVVDRYTALGGKAWRPWLEVCQASGLKGVVRVSDSDAGTLRKLHDYLAEQQLAAETAAAQRATEAGDANPSASDERQPGEDG
jgi:hypothetical protein